MRPHPELKQPNVNVPNVLRTIELLEKLPDERFDMGQADPDPRCNSACCIMGHICVGLLHLDYVDEQPAGKFLRLRDDAAETLFYAWHLSDDEFRSLTRQQAIAVLKHLARTGEVDWSVAEDSAS